MTRKETLKIFHIICTAYPTVELSEEKIAMWQELLSDIHLQLAAQNLAEHIKTNRFPPTIADIRQSQHRAKKIDPEIEARNIEIAHAQWVRDGHDPEAFVYEGEGEGDEDDEDYWLTTSRALGINIGP